VLALPIIIEQCLVCDIQPDTLPE